MVGIVAVNDLEQVSPQGPSSTLDIALRFAALPDGGFVAIWLTTPDTSNGAYNLMGQRYDAAGRPVGAEFRVNPADRSVAAVPSIATLADGGFVVVWADAVGSELDPDGTVIRAQMYTAAGAREGGVIQVNTSSAGFSSFIDVAPAQDGGFLVSWVDGNGQGTAPSNTGADINVQAFDANGGRLGVPHNLDVTIDESQGDVAIAALTNGNYVAAYTFGPAATSDVFVQRLVPAGVAYGGETANTIAVAEDQVAADIIGLTNGGYVVLYVDGSAAADGSDLRYQVYDAFGVPVGLDRLVHEPSSGEYGQTPRLTALADGGFVVTWSTEGQAVGSDIRARVFDAAGDPIAPEFVVRDVSPTQSATFPEVIQLANGDLLFGWSVISELPLGPNTSVPAYFQRWSVFDDLPGSTPGADLLIGTTGRDRVFGEGGGDTLFGGGQRDVLIGGLGDDYLSGDDEADLLSGGQGNDVLLGGDGDDLLEASGNDLELIDDGADEVVGGDGTDTVSYRTALAGVNVSLVGAPGANESAGDTYLSIENITGTAFGDVLEGDGGTNVLRGDVGNDLLRGGAGADRLIGGEDFDTALYSGAAAGLVVDMEVVSASTGHATGDTFESIEQLSGSANGDTLRGTVGAQTLAGDDGDDVLEGRAGADVLAGGAGDDAASYGLARASVVADLGNIANNTGDAAGDTYSLIENLLGSAYADTLRGDAGDNRLIGRGGADTIQGRGGRDLIFGDEGADLLFGEDGDDVLDGGSGGDTLVGGLGGDVLTGREGADVLDGGAGGDVADYRDKTVAVSVTLNGATNVTVTVGGVAEDTIRNMESVYGGSGNDVFTGDAQRNVLNGFGGNDRLNGAANADTLTGGTGADVFVYSALGDSTVAAATRDTITDFVSGTDDIDLSAIDANSVAAGNQAFVLGVLAAGQFGRLQVTANGANSWLVQGDVTGDGAADFAIVVNGAVAPGASDFIL